MRFLTPIILLLPLLGFLALGLCGRLFPRALISVVACGTIGAAFVLSVVDFIQVAAHPSGLVFPRTVTLIWVMSGGFSVNFTTLTDPLTAVMLLVVTGVGFLIHVYSIGYMAE